MVYRPRVLPWSTDRGVLRPCVQVVCTRSCVQGRVYKAVCTRQCVQVVVYRPCVQSRVYRSCVQATFTKVACTEPGVQAWYTGRGVQAACSKTACTDHVFKPHRNAMSPCANADNT